MQLRELIRRPCSDVLRNISRVARDSGFRAKEGRKYHFKLEPWLIHVVEYVSRLFFFSLCSLIVSPAFVKLSLTNNTLVAIESFENISFFLSLSLFPPPYFLSERNSCSFINLTSRGANRKEL